MWTTKVNLNAECDDQMANDGFDHTLFVFLQEDAETLAGGGAGTIVMVIIDDVKEDGVQEPTEVIEIPLIDYPFPKIMDNQGNAKNELKKVEYLAMARGHLILADTNTVFYMNLIKTIKEKAIKFKTRGEKVAIQWSSFTIQKVDDEGFQGKDKCGGHLGFELKGIDDMGHGDAALVLEEQKNHFLVFIKLELSQKQAAPNALFPLLAGG